MLIALAAVRALAASEYCNMYSKKNYQKDASAYEAVILIKLSQYKPFFPRLKDEYNLLYSFCADFIDDARWNSAVEVSNGLEQRIKDLDDDYEQEMDLSWMGSGYEKFDEEFDEEFSLRRDPVRVEKVGRNEPCPCGSGKKFKKCCGA